MKTTTMNQKAPRLGAQKPAKTRQTPSAPTGTATALTVTASAPLALLPQLPSATVTPLAFTVITGQSPNRLTKIIGLKADGTLRKETTANLYKGSAKRVTVKGLDELRTHLDALVSANAVSWGITRKVATDLCIQSDEAAIAAGAIARTRDNFSFPQGPGIVMLDHDGVPNGSLSPDEFRGLILVAAPVLVHAPMLWRPSASAGCLHPNGQVLTPLDRHRLYLPVQDASLIPEAGKALTDLLWAQPGGGWVDISVSGQTLMRCLVDTSVWQPERLDFTSPPVLEDGVTRPGTAGVIYGQEDGLFDLRLLIDSLTPAIRKEADAARKAARAAAKPACTEQAKKWAADHAPALAARRGVKLTQAVNVLERASLYGVLMGDFELQCSDGAIVTVAQLLDNAAIDSFITSPSYKDRILGESTTQELPNKALFLMTGNNLVLTGDTYRRVLIVRLDAQQEQPFTREFAFNPLDEVINNRQQMVVAALTIVRAYITAGRPKAAPGRIASFELWDDLVRQPLCWLRKFAADSAHPDLPVFDWVFRSIVTGHSGLS